MRISGIKYNKINQLPYSTGCMQNSFTQKPDSSSQFKSLPSSSQNFNVPLQASHIKANFLPSFGKSRNVGYTYLTDRTTGNLVKASVKKDKAGDFSFYSLFVGRKEAGYITVDNDSVVPEDDFVITESTNKLPEIVHLRSLEGEKYSGIGTELIKIAVQESYNNGTNGNLWLKTEKGYAKNLSDYRSNENPIPFYYKVGFASPVVQKDKNLRLLLEKGDYKNLPSSELLMLTPSARDAWVEYLKSNPIIKFKNN